MQNNVASRRQLRDIESSINISVSNNHTPLRVSQKDNDPDETAWWGFCMSRGLNEFEQDSKPCDPSATLGRPATDDDYRRLMSGTSNMAVGLPRMCLRTLRLRWRVLGAANPPWVNVDRLP